MENDTTSYLKAWLNLLGGPILFFVILLLPASPSHQNAFIVIAVASWMVLWWVTETVALSITAMLPMVLFPLLGILDIKVAMAPYAHPMIFLFFGGFIIALAMEKRRLHARVALNLILITGTNANGIILGFMIALLLLVCGLVILLLR